MTLNCIIIDDSISCINLLEDYISESKTKLHLIKAYTDPNEALVGIRNLNSVDVVFMDVLMPLLNGIELSILLKDKIRYLVITTGDPSYAIDAFEVNACNYLLKPIAQKKFNNAIDKIASLEKEKSGLLKDTTHFFIKSNIGEIRKININNIIAVQGASNYVRILTSDQKSYITYGKMQDYEKKLEILGKFARVSKSFIISIPAIKLVTGKKVILNNDLEVSIGDTYKNSIKKHLKML